MLFLSYPSIESFTVSNFEEHCFDKSFDTGHSVKVYAHEQKDFDIDAFEDTSKKVFYYEEKEYQETSMYRLLSLMVIALLDLGLIEVE